MAIPDLSKPRGPSRVLWSVVACHRFSVTISILHFRAVRRCEPCTHIYNLVLDA
jgi:hypothetical protein